MKTSRRTVQYTSSESDVEPVHSPVKVSNSKTAHVVRELDSLPPVPPKQVTVSSESLSSVPLASTMATLGRSCSSSEMPLDTSMG